MDLIWATEDLVFGGRPFRGFPILLWDSMESCIPANEFLRHHLTRATVESQRSWPNAGRALYDYFSFLQAHDLAWNGVLEGEGKGLLAGYRDYCSKEVNLARNTVRQRLHYVCEFYDHALQRGWIERLPFAYEERRVPAATDFFEHLDASGGQAQVRDVIPRKHRSLPKFLSKDEARSLLLVAQNPHHQMMIRFALQTGLRLEEIVTFPLAYVFDPARSGRGARNLRVTLDPQDGHGIKTKGNKSRDIYVGSRLMSDVHRYAVQSRGLLAARSEMPSSTLFLSDLGEPYASHGKSFGRIVRQLGSKAGVKVHTHMLRHTYATHTLAALQRNRGQTEIEPLVFLQRQLGHESIQTTMIYLHLIHELADEAVLAYDDELNDWMTVSNG